MSAIFVPLDCKVSDDVAYSREVGGGEGRCDVLLLGIDETTQVRTFEQALSRFQRLFPQK